MDLQALRRMPVAERRRRVFTLRRAERELLVELLWHLVYIESDRLLGALGAPTMWSFLTKDLGFARTCASRRIVVARLLARIPAIGDYLADGRLNLTQVFALRHVLNEENADTLLAAAVGRSERSISASLGHVQPGAGVAAEKLPLAVNRRPATAEARELQVVLSESAHRKLIQVGKLLAGQVPEGDLSALLEACFDRVLAEAGETGEVPAAAQTAQGPKRKPPRRVPSSSALAATKRAATDVLRVPRKQAGSETLKGQRGTESATRPNGRAAPSRVTRSPPAATRGRTKPTLRSHRSTERP